MTRRTKIYIFSLIILLILCNYYVYIERIKYEVWEINNLIFFLGIINTCIILVPTIIYFVVCEIIEYSRQEKISEAILYIAIKKQQEVKELKEELNKYEGEKNE